MASARARAAQVQTQAQAEATRLLSEADDYVDRKLGDFEVTLDRLLQQVQRGREHLSERAAADRAHGLTADADLATVQVRRPRTTRPRRRARTTRSAAWPGRRGRRCSTRSATSWAAERMSGSLVRRP